MSLAIMYSSALELLCWSFSSINYYNFASVQENLSTGFANIKSADQPVHL